jgi:hypothetical protein
MTPRPSHTKKDKNHAPIRDDLRRLGAVVVDVADLGGKCGDLVVSWRGKTIHVEVKDTGKRDDLTPGELEFMRELEAVGCRLIVAETTEEVISAFSPFGES